MTSSFKTRPNQTSARQDFDDKLQSVQVRGGCVPKKWNYSTTSSTGSRLSELILSKKGVVITDILVMLAPSDPAGGDNYIEVIEDTAENSFASGTTTLLHTPAVAAAYNTNGSFVGINLCGVNIYSDYSLRFKLNLGSGMGASEILGVLVGYLDEAHITATVGASAGEWDY